MEGTIRVGRVTNNSNNENAAKSSSSAAASSSSAAPTSKRGAKSAGMPSTETAKAVSAASTDPRLISSSPFSPGGKVETVELSPIIAEMLAKSKHPGQAEHGNMIRFGKSLATPEHLSGVLATGMLPSEAIAAASKPPNAPLKSEVARKLFYPPSPTPSSSSSAAASSGTSGEETGTKKSGGRRRKTKHRKYRISKHRKHRKTRRRVRFDRI